VTSVKGKVSLVDKMRIQTLHKQRLGATAIMAAHPDKGGAQHIEDLPVCWSNGVGNRTQSWLWLVL